MSSKIFLDSYSAYLESIESGKGISTNIDECDTLVNPSHSSICGKTIMINLPIDTSIDILKHYNKVVSRFDIDSTIPVIPYKSSEPEEIPIDEFSGLILNKYMLSDPKYLELIQSNKFILGMTECVGDNLTLVGKLVSKYKVKNS